MDSNQRSITLAEAFPALAPSLDPALRSVPLVTLRRLKAWNAIVQTLALGAARRRDLGIGELVPFPLPWSERELGDDWNPPHRCRTVGPRTLRTLERAGLRCWCDLLDRTPQELLEGSGAGLMMLSDVLSCAIELAAMWLTEPAERQSAMAFGVSRKNYASRRAGS
jgi:hypothetical protein